MRYLVFAICTAVVSTSIGVADARAESRLVCLPLTPGTIKLVILSKAREEITRLGYKLPDKPMMKALQTLGFRPTVTYAKGTWHVVHPLGHPWAISRIHLEFDPRGKLVRHRLDPGE